MSRNRSGQHRGRSKQGRNRGQQTRRGPKKENIHPSKFVQAAKPQQSAEYIPTHAFADFNVHPQLKQNIAAREFSAPSPIQDQIIPHGIDGRDVIGIANTGTGKTMAFAIPVLHQLMSNRDAKAIVVAPTRELAEQVLDECRTLVGGSKVRWALLIGGSSMGRQLQDMSRRPNLVIGTPGRMKDHIERGSLRIHQYNMAVLDEVDRMLDMGFVNDMRSIIGGMSPKRQSFFFSATIDKRVRGIIDDFSVDPVEVSVKTGSTSENVEQSIVHYHDDDNKLETLSELLQRGDISKALVFDDTRGRVEKLSRKLTQQGIKSESIHGGRSQGQRKRALSNFKESHVRVLVATDVAARGIDISDISHVINYSTPQSYEDYVHRVGRAGRAGKKGHAYTFLPKR